MLLHTLMILPLCMQGPSEKELFDMHLNAIQTTQMSDGSYGGNTVVTANVLIGMALSPRAYRVDDGPFIRDGVKYLLEHKDDVLDDWERDQRIGMALLHVHRDRYRSSAEALVDRHGKTLRDLRTSRPAQRTAYALDAIPPDADLVTVARALADAGLNRTYIQTMDPDAPHLRRKALRAAYEKGVDYLLANRGPSGYWDAFGRPEPGISALAGRALLGSDREEVRAVGTAVADWLLTMQHEDGSIHGGQVAVYTTSVAIGLLTDLGRPQDEEAIARAVGFLKVTQTDESEGYSEGDKFYGGIGYGGDLRPDLSNLQYALQALSEAGVESDDEAFQRAVFFLNRSQNRKESNPGTYYDAGKPKPVRSGDDGGAMYYPGNSPAGTEALPDGSLIARSYGSMTYALLKCFTFAGVPKEDPRMVAAIDWISSHWTLEVNPGFDPMRDPRGGFQGLYYYYLSLAQALSAAKIDSITAVGGKRHDWRMELGGKLLSLQHEDGHWVNEDAPRWWEGNPQLCTAYSLGALKVLLDG